VLYLVIGFTLSVSGHTMIEGDGREKACARVLLAQGGGGGGGASRARRTNAAVARTATAGACARCSNAAAVAESETVE
jgi:CxxC motif-containing protein (DUF1111 family)